MSTDRKVDSTAAKPVRAIVVDDERLLADALMAELKACWPELVLAEPLGDGETALQYLLEERPDVAFLDVRMPGLSGLEVARLLADAWPPCVTQRPPLIVFVTAFSEFAVQAFDNAAVDYLIKPVVSERLMDAITRVKDRLSQRTPLTIQAVTALDRTAQEALSHSLGVKSQPLTRICAASGDTIHIVAIENVLLFEADDKYVNVHTSDGVMLIRRSLRDLLPSLDPAVFMQIHRRVIVNVTKIKSAKRAGPGRMNLIVEGTDYHPPVSRSFAHLFKPM